MSDWDDPPPGTFLTSWGALRYERRRQPRPEGSTFRRGMRVIVLGPFEARVGHGTIRKITATHRGLIVDLDSGKDVLVARRFARPL